MARSSKPFVSMREYAWVGSTPTRLRQKSVSSSSFSTHRKTMKQWIALNMTPGVGPRAATKLLERFGSADAVFHARRHELESLRLKPETDDSIIKHEFHDKAAVELETVKQLGGDVLILDDGSYPALLR